MNSQIGRLKESFSRVQLLASMVLILAFVSVATDRIQHYNKEISLQQAQLELHANGDMGFWHLGDWGDDRPLRRIGVLLLSFFVLLGLRKSSRLLFPTLFTVLSFLILVHWGIKVWYAIQINEIHQYDPWKEKLLVAANPIDYLLFISISALLVWLVHLFCKASRFSSYSQ